MYINNYIHTHMNTEIHTDTPPNTLCPLQVAAAIAAKRVPLQVDPRAVGVPHKLAADGCKPLHC